MMMSGLVTTLVEFPSYVVDEVIKSYLDYKKANVKIKTEPSKFDFDTLSHIRDISEKTKKKNRDICEEFCTETKVSHLMVVYFL